MKDQIAEVFYHVNERSKQKIIVDADNIEGNILFPKLVKSEVEVKDARTIENKPTFGNSSIEFFNYETNISSFEGDSFKKEYNQELKNLLMSKVNAKEVIVFDHTIREDKSSIRPPARHAHVDYSKKSAEEQIHKYVIESERNNWLKGHYAIVNTWRPIKNKVLSAPLGFVLPHTVSNDELIEIDLVYPERMGEVLGALYNKNHKWVYLSEMDPSEIVLFSMFDNKGRMPVIHSAFDLEDTKKGTIRKSIESRILIRF